MWDPTDLQYFGSIVKLKLCFVNGSGMVLSTVVARYWWEYDSNIKFFTGSKQMREGVNPLKMKRRLPYLKTQSIPHCKHFSSQL
jgi:hypothetical protein